MNAPADSTPSLAGRRFGIVFGLLAGALIGLWLLLNALDQADRGEAAVAWLDQTLEQQRRRSEDTDAYAQEVAAVRKELAQFEQQLPAQLDAAEIDAGLRALAERHGLALGSVARDPEQVRDFYASVGHRFELRGTAPALQAFFRDYAEVVPLQRVASLRLRAADGELFVAEVQADYFRYIEDTVRR